MTTKAVDEHSSSMDGPPRIWDTASKRATVLAEASAIRQSSFHYIATNRESMTSKRMQAAIQAHTTASGTIIRVAA